MPPPPQVYVWIYDPVHFKTFAMGLILGESCYRRLAFPTFLAAIDGSLSLSQLSR